jgi:hypothetical protein
MTQRFFVLLVMLMISIIKPAHAEGGCPPGQYPQQGQGWQTCVPIPTSDAGPQRSQPVHVPSKSLDQWQAIATDTTVGVIGTSADKTTWGTAESAAISDCQQKGGTDCKIDISYANGCVALVFGNALKNSKGGSNQKQAEGRAMDQCNKDDTNCRVIYSACSLPIEVPQ